MGNNTQHIFCGVMTIDGQPVNAERTYDNRKINEKLQDRADGYYRRLSPSELHHGYKDCAVYLWVSYDELEGE